MLLLETKNLAKHFGGLKALDGIDMRVERERIVSIIGPNGAGKTTFFNCITGMYQPTKGKAIFHDRDITGMSPHDITSIGHCAHVPEHPPVQRHDPSLRTSWWRRTAGRAPECSARSSGPGRVKKEERDMEYRAMDISEIRGARRQSMVRLQRTSPMATSGGWRSHGRSGPSRTFCSLMNLPPG